MKVQYFLRLALLPLMAAPALAGPRDDVMSASARCAGITDDRAWLDCYYGAAQPMRAQLGLAPAPASQIARVPAAQNRAAPRPAPQASAAAPARTGMLDGLLGGGTGIVKMASYRFDAHGKFTVTLGNGQVWEQLATDLNTAHWREDPSKYRISVVERYGRIELTVDNDGQIYQVRQAN